MITVCILTVSDSAITGQRADLSGPALRARCEEFGWQVTAAAVVPDESSAIAERLRGWADGGIGSVVLTTGGTGVSARDVTPDATRTILEREIPGLAELMRDKGQQQTKFSVLSRAVAGTRNRSLIVNLPGSPSGAVFSLEVIHPFVTHIVELLEGRTDHQSNAKLKAGLETPASPETSDNL